MNALATVAPQEEARAANEEDDNSFSLEQDELRGGGVAEALCLGRDDISLG